MTDCATERRSPCYLIGLLPNIAEHNWDDNVSRIPLGPLPSPRKVRGSPGMTVELVQAAAASFASCVSTACTPFRRASGVGQSRDTTIF